MGDFMIKYLLFFVLFSAQAQAGVFSDEPDSIHYPCSKKAHLNRQVFMYHARNLEITPNDTLKFDIYSRSFTCKKGSFWRRYQWEDLGFKENQSFAWKYKDANGDVQTNITPYVRSNEEDYKDIHLYHNRVSIPLSQLTAELSGENDILFRIYMASDYAEEGTKLSLSYYKLSFKLHYSEQNGYTSSEELFTLINPVIPHDGWFKKKDTTKVNNYDYAFCFDKGTSVKIYIDNAPPSRAFPYYKTNIRFFRNNRLLGGFNSKKTLNHSATTDHLYFEDTKFSDDKASLEIWADLTTETENGWLDATGKITNWDLPGTDGQNLKCKLHKM